MRFDLSSNPDITSRASALAIFDLLSKRGVGRNASLAMAAKLASGELVEDVEIELVFSRDEFVAEMATAGIDAKWKGGDARMPFTVALQPAADRAVWTRAVDSVLQTRGRSKDEAEGIARRLEAGESVADVAMPWVMAQDEELLIDQFENYGVLAIKIAGAEPPPTEVCEF